MIYTTSLDSVEHKISKTNYSVKMSNSNTGKRKNFAYVTVPQHVITELITLNGIQFNSK